jgi:CHASE3 domain sensor protein
VFETRRLEEMKDEKGLRRNQKVEQIRKEFEKHPDNPFNQVSGRFDSTREELREIADAEKKKVEARLAGS